MTTLHSPTDNVALAHGQRCTRPRTTLPSPKDNVALGQGQRTKSVPATAGPMPETATCDPVTAVRWSEGSISKHRHTNAGSTDFSIRATVHLHNLCEGEGHSFFPSMCEKSLFSYENVRQRGIISLLLLLLDPLQGGSRIRKSLRGAMRRDTRLPMYT